MAQMKCLLYYVGILLALIEGIAMSDEKRLIKHLLSNYERVGIVGRPVYNTSDTIYVKYGMALIQILDLDEKNQVLTTNVWSRYEWEDILLRWDPADYGGLTDVRVPVADIWTPDIVLYNYADTRLQEQREALAVISNNGNVLWIPMAIYRSTCSIDIRDFPYDMQECHLKFGSWTYDGFKLDLQFYQDLDKVDTADYVPSNEWRLIASPAKKNTKYYPCCDEPYPDLTFVIKVKRLAIFYSYIIILPCVLLSLLTVVVFWLPPESPAKMLLGMNIFVAFFLLLRILADSTPPASASVPLIGVYFCLNMVLITLSAFLSVIVINLYHRTDKKNTVPDWIRKYVVHGMSRFFGLYYDTLRNYGYRGPVTQKEHVTHVLHSPSTLHRSGSGRRKDGCGGSTKDKSAKKIKSPVMSYNKWEPPPFAYTDSPIAGRHPSQQGHSSHPSHQGHPSHLGHPTSPGDLHSPIIDQVFEAEVKEIRRTMRNFMNKIRDRDAVYRVNLEWRVVALVLDRIFFILYLMTILVALATIFPWSEAVGSY